MCSPRCRSVFAWEAYEKGTEVHLQADPTKLELLHQSFRVKKEDFKDKQKESILEKVQPNTTLAVRSFFFLSFFEATVSVCECCLSASRLQYGGQEHLDAPPQELLLAQTEDYVEYSRHGAVIKGQEKAIARSKYEEDVLINNHTVSTAEGCQDITSAIYYLKMSFILQCIWGSFWKDGSWGYKCCHSLVKQSYCTGDTGKKIVVRSHFYT